MENIDEFVDLRIKSANLFLDALDGCDFLTAQFIPKYSDNSYWALGLKYSGEEKYGVSWFDFRRLYMENGGDGVYGAWSVPYLEPLMQNMTFIERYPQIYNNLSYQRGLCPVAEKIQKQMMVFKTNYRDIRLARQKAHALSKTIKEIAG